MCLVLAKILFNKASVFQRGLYEDLRKKNEKLEKVWDLS